MMAHGKVLWAASVSLSRRQSGGQSFICRKEAGKRVELCAQEGREGDLEVLCRGTRRNVAPFRL